MKDQYEYTINSTDDIRRALAEAGREGYELTHYTARFDLRGKADVPISVDAYDSATVYADGRSEVDVSCDASVYVASDDVIVNAFGDAKVYLPAPGVEGSQATVNVPDGAGLDQVGAPEN